MKISDAEKHKIKEVTKEHLLNVIRQYVPLEKEGTGANYAGKCPICGSEHSLKYNDSKKLFKCFKCNQFSGTDAVTFLMKGFNKSWIDAMESLANMFHIPLEYEQVKLNCIRKNKDSYCKRMLAASGLSEDDVTAHIYKSDDKKSIFQCRTFKPGTINDKGEIVKGDDCIIEYYDLDGFPVHYETRTIRGKGGTTKEYYRVRWQYPEEHLDKNGKPFKYKSPPGSGTPIYIPQRMRDMYHKKELIQRLYIQEGEKKAEKCCKEGLPSVAVSGINNLGMKGSFPEDLLRIIRDCGVKEVVFLFDSDFNDLSRDIKLTDSVDKRPRNFFYAARNYKEYMRSLKNREIYVEIYIGHVNPNQHEEKGVDDLLAGSLAGHTQDLSQDVERAINDKSLRGDYITLYKITEKTDYQIAEIWSLNNPAKFAQTHRKVLENLPEFKIGKHSWKFDEQGNFVSAQSIDSDEMFWEAVQKTNRNGDLFTEYKFKYVGSQVFLQNRGFGRYLLADGTWQFIHLENPFVKQIESYEARDFLFDFAKSHCNVDVLEMLIKGVSQFVGPDKLSILEFITPTFLQPNREEQYLYFEKTCWKVSISNVREIGYEQITHNVWKNQQINFSPKYLGTPLISFKGEDMDFTLSEDGKKCHFLQFLINASNYTWRKERAIRQGEKAEITQDELRENRQHLLSKLCAIGYMAMEVKDANVSRAVIGMDGKQSEVGESNGRSGKSLIGELMRQVLPIAYIDGKKRDMFNDVFIWNDVTEKTKLVFIDDVLQSFQFENLFPCITGDWNVNYKGGRRVTYPFDKSPKIYIATNHAIRGTGSSFSDRQWLLAFSDYYNDTHKPTDDFGCLFFKEWDYNQWNLCWNMIVTCIQLYLRFGVVQAPGERLEQRKLRQEITESFIAWAEEYFSASEKRNARIAKKELQESYFAYDPQQRKYVSPTEFKKRFMKYCQWKGYNFNPQMFDPITGKPFKFDRDGRPITDDKSGGVEYFTLGDKNFSGIDQPDPLDSSPSISADLFDF